jgi:hypothetical protein
MEGAAVPPGAVRLRRSFGFLGEAPTPRCTHLSTATTFWRVAHGMAFVKTCLLSHPAAGMTLGPSGTGGARGKSNAYSFLNEQRLPKSALRPTAALLYVYLPDGHGSVEIRVDAFALGSGAVCQRRL